MRVLICFVNQNPNTQSFVFPEIYLFLLFPSIGVFSFVVLLFESSKSAQFFNRKT